MITILTEGFRPHPLSLIHRAEARAIGAELRAAGESVRFVRWDGTAPGAVATDSPPGRLLVRVSDPVLTRAVRVLTDAGIAYCGPGADALARCYDKAHAYALAQSHGVDCPITMAASDADALPGPLILKRREGSDSIGLRLLRAGAIPAACRNDGYLAQRYVAGTELTVGVMPGEAGMPLRIALPDGTPYWFWRKYLWAPRKIALESVALAERVRTQALRIARVFGIDWAARVDFIYERDSDRLVFLECDAAPLVGPGSAYAESFSAAGLEREAQLRRLLALQPLRAEAGMDMSEA